MEDSQLKLTNQRFRNFNPVSVNSFNPRESKFDKIKSKVVPQEMSEIRIEQNRSQTGFNNLLKSGTKRVTTQNIRTRKESEEFSIDGI